MICIFLLLKFFLLSSMLMICTWYSKLFFMSEGSCISDCTSKRRPLFAWTWSLSPSNRQASPLASTKLCHYRLRFAIPVLLSRANYSFCDSDRTSCRPTCHLTFQALVITKNRFELRSLLRRQYALLYHRQRDRFKNNLLQSITKLRQFLAKALPLRE